MNIADASVYSYKKPVYKFNDRASALAAVSRYGHTLKDLCPAFRADKQIVLAAVKRNGFALGYASDELRRDREVLSTL